MACCDSVGGQLGWNAKQKARCENACMLVGLPNWLGNTRADGAAHVPGTWRLPLCTSDV